MMQLRRVFSYFCGMGRFKTIIEITTDSADTQDADELRVILHNF